MTQEQTAAERVEAHARELESSLMNPYVIVQVTNTTDVGSDLLLDSQFLSYEDIIAVLEETLASLIENRPTADAE